MSIQDIKEQARGALHGFMSRPAHLFPVADDKVTLYAVTARYHSHSGLVGDLAGTSLSYAETHDDEETLVFWCAQLAPIYGFPGTPPRGVLVMFSDVEGYWVDNVRPVDGQTVTAEVTRAELKDLAGRPAPGTI